MFDFNLYSTPLLFGFIQGWIYALLFWARAFRQERLSDALFGCMLAALTFEIWEYMLGFGGVEVLWKELEFFPRNFHLLLPPIAWFYLRSQFNARFKFGWPDLKHAALFLAFSGYHILVYLQGPDFVQHWKDTIHFPYGIAHLEVLLGFVVQVVYFYLAYKLYREYQTWAPLQYSDTETLDFTWFRNFLVAFLTASVVSWVMDLLDIWLTLDFWHDWWDELFNVGLIYYLGIVGYAQKQPRKMYFEPTLSLSAASPSRLEKLSEPDMLLWQEKINHLMAHEKLYLDPELSLSDLARRLKTNVSILSAVVNGSTGKNFNDFVNEYRVEAVKTLLHDPDVSHLSLLGIGLECGFNSKSTFNRAFKKTTGFSPSEWRVKQG